MNVIGYHPPSSAKVHVPDLAVLANGTAVLRDGTLTDVPGRTSELTSPFELDSGKWFAVDGNTVVRFPKEREWEWRVKRATDIVRDMSGKPESRLEAMECAAGLAGVDLVTLVERLREAKESGEDLGTTFRRVHRSRL